MGFCKLYLVLIGLTLLSFGYAQDEQNIQVKEVQEFNFPVITQHINALLYEGKANEIKKFVEQRKSFIEGLLQNLTLQQSKLNLLIKNTEKQRQRDAKNAVVDTINNAELDSSLENLQQQNLRISEIINDFKDIHYKHINLLHELDRSDEPLIKIGNLPKPYTIFSIMQINGLLERLGQQFDELQIQEQQNEIRLDKITGLLSNLVVDYTINLEKNEYPLELYSILRNIYLYQADYAILKLKNARFSKEKQETQNQLEMQSQLLPVAIENMQILPENIELLSNNLQAIEHDLQKLREEHSKLLKDFDQISFKAELALDSIEIKLKNPDNTAKDREVLQLQKKFNLSRVKYSYFIKNLLQQKEQALLISKNEHDFHLSWLQAYKQRKSKPKEIKETLILWQNKLHQQSKSKEENIELLDSLNRSILEISGTQQQLSQISESEKPHSTAKLKKQVKILKKQLDKNLNTIQRLSQQLNQNNETIEHNNHKQERISKILSQQFNKIEQIEQWFGSKFNHQIEQFKKILYYPIASFGDKPFTLATLLKVILYIVLGIIFLKFFRARLAKFLIKRTKLGEGAAFSISTLMYYFGALLVFLAALSASGFNLGQMMIVFGALGVGIGFGLQNIANNFISGMILLIDRTLTVGDSITLNDGTHGKVSKLSMRYTVIRTNGGYDIIVPNSELISNRVTSMTFDDHYFRIEIPFGVSYSANPEQVREITLEVADSVKHTINRESQHSAVLFNGFGDNSLDFVLRVWVFIYDRYRPYAIKSDYYYKLFKAFKEAGIEVPFPQRDLHVRSVDDKVLMQFDQYSPAEPKSRY